jgi:flagellar biosynthesis/type III secretory pathway M-ring protein FliF/YscJ
MAPHPTIPSYDSQFNPDDNIIGGQAATGPLNQQPTEATFSTKNLGTIIAVVCLVLFLACAGVGLALLYIRRRRRRAAEARTAEQMSTEAALRPVAVPDSARSSTDSLDLQKTYQPHGRETVN